MSIAPNTRRTTEDVYLRLACDECGENATYRHTYLLENSRRNPKSRGYGKDDISWCSDAEVLTCDTCKKPSLDGMDWCASFKGERFPHMVHGWVKVKETILPPEAKP